MSGTPPVSTSIDRSVEPNMFEGPELSRLFKKTFTSQIIYERHPETIYHNSIISIRQIHAWLDSELILVSVPHVPHSARKQE